MAMSEEQFRAALKTELKIYFIGAVAETVPQEKLSGIEGVVNTAVDQLDVGAIIEAKMQAVLSALEPVVLRKAPSPNDYELIGEKTVSGSALGSRVRCYKPEPVIKATQPRAIAVATANARKAGAAMGADALFISDNQFSATTELARYDTTYAEVEANLTVAFYKAVPAPKGTL